MNDSQIEFHKKKLKELANIDVDELRDQGRVACELFDHLKSCQSRERDLEHQLKEHSFELFQREVNEWQNKTFPESTKDTVLTHLKREVNELCDLKNVEEAADCVLLLLAFSGKSGVSLIQEARRKFEINKKRKWGEPDAQGIREHVRE